MCNKWQRLRAGIRLLPPTSLPFGSALRCDLGQVASQLRLVLYQYNEDNNSTSYLIRNYGASMFNRFRIVPGKE